MTTLTSLSRSTLCVIQARMGSSRLPGKVLQPIDGVPMLAFMLRRIAGLQVDNIIVATSDLDRDTPVAEVARDCGVDVVRGSESDVLSRYITALDTCPSDIVVRLTADCPLTDPHIVEATIRQHVAAGADYTSNVFPRSFPKGLDVEVCTASALRHAARVATDPAEREHVTPYLYRHPELFKLANHDSGCDAGAERWTVDTAQDLEFVRSIVQRVGSTASWTEILAIVGRQAPFEAGLHLRPACDADLVAVLDWRNEADAVRWSTSQQKVDATAHQEWFQKVIHDPGRRLRIAEIDRIPVGFARLDITAGSASVSIAVDPRHRGHGIGAQILESLVAEASDDVQITQLTAAVHRENRASLRIFERVGFQIAQSPQVAADFVYLEFVA